MVLYIPFHPFPLSLPFLQAIQPEDQVIVQVIDHNGCAYASRTLEVCVLQQDRPFYISGIVFKVVLLRFLHIRLFQAFFDVCTKRSNKKLRVPRVSISTP